MRRVHFFLMTLLISIIMSGAAGCGDDGRESSGATGAISVRQVGDILTISNNILEISYDLTQGIYSVERRGRTAAAEGTPVVENAFVEVRSFPIFRMLFGAERPSPDCRVLLSVPS